jgi:hypothetical protein
VDHRCWFVTIVATAVLGGWSDNAWGREASQPTLAVKVYNYAAAPADVMRAASEKVAVIYRSAGVDLVWIEALGGESTGDAPASTSTKMFTVTILVRATRRDHWEPARKSVMGMALASDAMGGMLSLFYDRIVRVARQYRQPLADILAVAIAHEIGHVLLPPPAHSPTGIMSAEWEGDDIRHALVGTLEFTPAQSETIRRRVMACCTPQTE